jgi:hypothetical protein
LDNLETVRQTLATVTDRFAQFEAQGLDVHVDFPLFQRLALPIPSGNTKIPGIKIQDTPYAGLTPPHRCICDNPRVVNPEVIRQRFGASSCAPEMGLEEMSGDLLEADLYGLKHSLAESLPMSRDGGG